MRYWLIILAVASAVVCQTGDLLASCPAKVWVDNGDGTWSKVPIPEQIFCDDFDSYCIGGGLPGTPNCPEGAQKSMSLPRQVWYQTSYGTDIGVEDVKSQIIYDIYSGRYASRIQLGQQTVRDWVASPPVDQPNQILNFSRMIGLVHGSEYSAVIGSDTDPLVLTFAIGASIGKQWRSAGYMELAFNTVDNTLNTANTDYALWPKTTCCNGTVNAGPWPLLCAQGNPLGMGIPAESGCPAVDVYPPPIRNAIAVGSMPFLDTDPCHCGPYNHTPQSYNLTFFDGQLWWTLNTSVAQFFPGATLSGTRTPLDNAPVTPPANYPDGAQPGNFYLSSPYVDETVPKPAGAANYPVYRPYNTVKLSFKRNVVKIELTSYIPCSEVDPNDPTAGLYYWYEVTSVLDNVPLKYAGPFDRLRGGVGPGCELSSDTSWSGCVHPLGRRYLISYEGDYVNFDRVVLHGGTGYTVAGACCNAADGACTMELASQCITHGRWTQPSRTCEDTICCPLIYGDDNHDGSVDMTDFGALQACITTGGGAVGSACQCFDFNGSNSIDANDIQHFVDCAMGPAIPGDGAGSCQGRLP